MNTTKLLLLAVTIAIGTGAKAPADNQTSVMDRIEGMLDLSKASGSTWSRPAKLSSYARFYAWTDDKRTVLGVLTRFQPPGRHWVAARDLPVIMDGGCAFIQLRFDVQSGHITRLACNGLA